MSGTGRRKCSRSMPVRKVGSTPQLEKKIDSMRNRGDSVYIGYTSTTGKERMDYLRRTGPKSAEWEMREVMSCQPTKREVIYADRSPGDKTERKLVEKYRSDPCCLNATGGNSKRNGTLYAVAYGNENCGKPPARFMGDIYFGKAMTSKTVTRLLNELY